MEFLKALEEAKQQGISKEEFVKIWDSEVRLKLQKEESRILELRLAANATLKDSVVPENFLQKIEKMVKDYLKNQQEKILELKNNILSQNQIQYQEIAKLLETQAGLIGQVMRCELDRAVQQLHSGSVASAPTIGHVSGAAGLVGAGYGPSHPTSFNYVPAQTNDMYMSPENGMYPAYHGESDYPGDGKGRHSVSPENAQQSKKKSQPKKNKKIKPVVAIPESNENIEYLPLDGCEITLVDAQQIASSGNCYISPYYILDDCPSCKVRLNLWFGSKSILVANLSIMGTSNDPLPIARIFECVGYVKNKNSGAFSQLFEIVSQPLRRLKSNKENQALGSVCLKTSGGSFKDVTFQDLEERGFIINNNIVIKWVSESFEAN
ncbi:hypothetical protein Bpfe_017253 [Biomphalaria pfeifferi]|uniref:Uncharacterized protein n=1 Tax=Biomphalaria pfeifferi TaxID=112525 RepID=A0AAD8BEW2_BIOPF|nr:hypothetical protein Bpfe_017253 [Biomphalaria pfeifferi]